MGVNKMNERTKTQLNVKTVSMCAMMAALAFGLTFLSRTFIPPLFPSANFLTFDLKDVILVISALLLGPIPALIITCVAAFLEMVTISSTAWIGFIMNIISSSAFILPCALLYRRSKTWTNALTGLIIGVVSMTAVMILWNYFLTPLYMGVPKQVVVDMLLPTFLPFNLLKGGVNAALTLLIYKPIVKALRAARLLPVASDKGGKSNTVISIVTAVLILAACAAAIYLLNK